MTVTRVMNGRSKLTFADPQLSTERRRLAVAHFIPHDLLYARPPTEMSWRGLMNSNVSAQAMAG
jgi:hypothetical protein